MIYNNIVLLEGNKKTETGRIYPVEELQKAVDSYNNTNSTMLGELGGFDELKVSLDNVSHKIDNLRIENNNIVGDVKILETPYGKIVDKIIQGYGFDSLRFCAKGSGHYSADGETIRDYDLITFNISVKDKE
jgi:hypothetical protein